MNFILLSRLISLIPLLMLLPACQLLRPQSLPMNQVDPTATDRSPRLTKVEDNPTSSSSVYPPSPSQQSLTVDSGAALPRLNLIDLIALKWEASGKTDVWLGLAGFKKVNPPSKFPSALKSFRDHWRKIDPSITPFLGLWHDDGGSANHIYFLSIFPSVQSGQVCILETRPEWKLAQEILLNPILSFSTATVSQGQLRSSRLRAAKSTIFQVQEEFYDEVHTIEILPILDSQDQIRVFSAKSPPRFPPDFSAELISEISQELSQRGCMTDAPSKPLP